MTANTWNIAAAHSGIGFSVRHMVVSKVRGRFAKFAGTVHIEDADVARSEATVTVDAASIDTGVPDRDAHLRSPEFDVEKFPELRFRSKRVEKIDDVRYRLVGDLTIRDVTRDVSHDVEYGGRAKDPWGIQRVGFVGRTSIDRRDFGLSWNQLLETGGILIGDRVDVDIEIEGVRGAS